MTTDKLDLKTTAELEAKYDPEMHFRQVVQPAKIVCGAMLLAMSLWHMYIAWGGMPQTHWLAAIHLAFVLSICFLVYGATKRGHDSAPANRWLSPGGVPLYDWALSIGAAVSALYIPWTLDDLAFRVGNPTDADMVFGTILIFVVIEAARRSMGWPLTVIVLGSLLYAVYGYLVPGLLAHPGSTWGGVVSHIYLLDQGIFGIPIQVMATLVFHFVLFGVIATRMGLGQLFIDIGYCIAGKSPGGPAKVSVISSAMMGTISGSSVANTVTTGSLTIPAMKRIGYRPHFAAAVEAASSTGGQITPPIMGAAAFVMAEFLAIPYLDICIAAAVPALMHYVGVFTIVHFEARRTGLRGLTAEELPRLGRVLRDGWPTIIPLVVLVTIIFQGYTPYKAAFWGIITALAVGMINPRNRMSPRDVLDTLMEGSRYAIAVGTAAAAVGIFVGVITLSGLGFKVSYAVTQAAAQFAEDIMPLFSFLPADAVTLKDVTLFITLVFIGLACIAMGTGIPTTALYIILAAIAAPALVLMGVPQLAAHLFVLYYGVLADLTPPVCVAAYAAAGIAGSNPFRTGVQAFQMGNAKVLVPFVFVYSPVMLIVAVPGFNWVDFAVTTGSCLAGIFFLGMAIAGFAFARLGALSRIVLAISAVMMISPNVTATVLGIALAMVPLGFNRLAARRLATA
ncbi:C4-dicarboxylate ABC transporter permease [Allostella vacuolata]|nr:C4-dicarboxylate ABC transporter permease [Stella vacuolata]